MAGGGAIRLAADKHRGRDSVYEVARPPRLERGTLCLEGRCSIQLSYGRNRVFQASKTGRYGVSIARNTLIFRHVPSAIYYARLRLKGKLIWRGRA